MLVKKLSVALFLNIYSPTSAHLVPGAVSEDLEDKLLLREGLLHCVYGGLVRALCRDLRPLLLKGEGGVTCYIDNGSG